MFFNLILGKAFEGMCWNGPVLFFGSRSQRVVINGEDSPGLSLGSDPLHCVLIGELIVQVALRRPHSLNIFCSETTGPIKVKLHMELLWDRGTNVCSNCHGHMTKMAAMLMCGKTLKQPCSLIPKGR